MYAEKIKMNKSLIKQNSYNLFERGNKRIIFSYYIAY